MLADALDERDLENLTNDAQLANMFRIKGEVKSLINSNQTVRQVKNKLSRKKVDTANDNIDDPEEEIKQRFSRRGD